MTPPPGHHEWQRTASARHAQLRRAVHGHGMPHLALGIFLTLLGIVLTFDRLDLVDATRALRWWPLGFHVLGATVLLRRTDTHGRFWGIAWLVIGTWLLLNTLNLVRVGFWDLLWPAFLIFVGIRLMARGRLAGPDNGAPASGAAPNLVAVLSEARGSVTQAFSRASLTSVLGGCHLDLRQATLQPGEHPVLDVFAFMGGHEVVVPHGWTVVLDTVTILAAAEDKRLPALAGGDAPAAGPALTIRGTLLFGGLTIKN